MKFSPNRVSPTRHTITSYRLLFGSRRLRNLGFINPDGTTKEVLPIISKGNIILMPIDEKLDKLTFEGFTTTVCKHGNIFFGEIENFSGSPTWYCASDANIEQSFHKLVAELTIPFA